MHRRSGSGGGGSGGGNYGGGRYNYGSSQSQSQYDREFMDEMAFRREMMQRGMMGDMSFYGGMGMNPMGMNMGMGGMMMNMNNQGNRGMMRDNNRGQNRDNRNKQQQSPRGGGGGNMQGNRRDNNRGDNQNRNQNQNSNRGGAGGMNRNRSDPGQGSHQRRLSDLRQDRDQNRRRDRDQQQWDRRGGPQNLQVKETGPLGKIKAISRRIKEWGNFGHGLPYWTKRANIYRRFSNFLERGSLDHTIVFIGHGSDCVCRIYVDELYLAEGSGASKSEARSDAYYRAVERLRLRNFDAVINKDDKFNIDSLKGYEVDQVISESPSNSLTYESNYANVATKRIADFNYPWDKLVIVERAGMSNAGLKLRLSCNLNGMLLVQNTSKGVPPGETKPKWRFAITLENKPLSEAFHERQGIARSNACIEAMKKLDPVCWRLKVERHRFPKLKTIRDDRRHHKDKDGKKKDEAKTEEKTEKAEEKEEPKTEEKEEAAETTLDESKEGDLDQSTKEEKNEEEEEEHHEETDEPFQPPVADLRRADLVDPEETAKGLKEEDEEEEKETKEDAEDEAQDKDESMEEDKKDDEEKKDETDEKKESSKLEMRLKQKMEAEAKQRKKSEFLFKIRKALEDKLTEFSNTRNFNQLVLEGFWMEERDHVVRLCRKLNMRSYVDKYRNDDGKIIHFIFVSQIIPMDELVSALKKAPEMKLGLYSLHEPNPAEPMDTAESSPVKAKEEEKEPEKVEPPAPEVKPETKTTPKKETKKQPARRGRNK